MPFPIFAMKKPYPSEEEINQEQMKKLLQFIETSQSESVKESLFGQLGRECFQVRKLDRWLESYSGDGQAFLDRVNLQKADKYWERLEFTEDAKTLVLTGRKVQRCACRFADCPQPPLSLCHYCCKSFQQEFFRRLLGREVEVKITASFLLGDDRCSTEIYLVDE